MLNVIQHLYFLLDLRVTSVSACFTDFSFTVETSQALVFSYMCCADHPGFEPGTLELTALCSAVELMVNEDATSRVTSDPIARDFSAQRWNRVCQATYNELTARG